MRKEHKAAETFAFIGVLLVLSLLVGCQAQRPGQAGYRKIISIPQSQTSERKATFLSCSVDEQIDIYLYSQYSVEGGSDEIFRFMASDGEMKIPSILNRLNTNKDSDPRAKVGLIKVLDFIDEDCHCLAATDDALAVLSRNEMPLEPDDSEGVKGFKELYHQIRVRIEARTQPNKPQ